MKLYLMRHAQSAHFNAQPAYRQWPGPALTQQGREDALAAGTWLQGRGIQRVLTSPFLRSLETAALVGRQLQVAVIPLPALQEGAPAECLASIMFRLSALWHDPRMGHTDPTSVGRHAPQFECAPVVCVTHGGILLAMLDHLLGHFPRERCMHDGESPCAPGSVLVLECASNRWEITMEFNP